MVTSYEIYETCRGLVIQIFLEKTTRLNSSIYIFICMLLFHANKSLAFGLKLSFFSLQMYIRYNIQNNWVSFIHHLYESDVEGSQLTNSNQYPELLNINDAVYQLA